MTEFSVNGRHYRPPAKPVVVICLDGSADEYLDATINRGRMPVFQKMSVEGHRGFARGAMPSFTNVNNSSIVTGVPPSVHGIGGNFFYDTEKGAEVMMNSATYLRCGTILAAAARAGRKVGVVTAKEKLRDIFSHELTGIAFSSEKAREATLAKHGIEKVEEVVGKPTPAIYSAEASLYVLEAGVALLRRGMADFLYLSTTDFMQHKFEPEEEPSLAFYEAIDRQVGELLKLGAVVGVTADHGMNAKQTAAGNPNVIFLESMLTERFGSGFRVILPITDPYVRHHGALGSFAQVHLPNVAMAREVGDWLIELDGVTEVYERAIGAKRLELPIDRMGDLVVMSGRDVVLGRTPDYHNLAELDAGLRSHGGRYEEMVPFLLSEPLNPAYRAKARRDVRNFDIFDFTINGGKHD